MAKKPAHVRFADWVAKYKNLDEAGVLLGMSSAYISLLVNKKRTPELYSIRMKIEEVVGIPAADWDK